MYECNLRDMRVIFWLRRHLYEFTLLSKERCFHYRIVVVRPSVHPHGATIISESVAHIAPISVKF